MTKSTSISAGRGIPRICHSPASYAVEYNAMRINVACRIDGDAAMSRLILTLKGRPQPDEVFNMIPTGRHVIGNIEWELFTTELPADTVFGAELCYTVGPENEPSECIGPFTVPLVSVADLPPLPPLAISEIFARPKGLGVTFYVEVMNPGIVPVDLYDYELLVFARTLTPTGTPTGRLPLARKPGVALLSPGEYAAVWMQSAKNLSAGGESYLTAEDFCRAINSEFSYSDLNLTPDKGRIIPVEYFDTDPGTGTVTPLPGICAIPEKHNPSVLLVVPRNGDADSAVFNLTYSTCYGAWDTPVKRSSYWKIDCRDPYHAVNISHADFATPGYPGRGQARPDPTASMPYIIPVAPADSVYIGDGDADIVFAAVPTSSDRAVTDADAHVVLPDGSERLCPAYQSSDGFWHARVASRIVERLGRLEYYITASDGTRTVTLSSPEGIAVPVYDNAPPRITSSFPGRGYAYDLSLTRETPVRISYYDVSGVRIRECRLVIDGKDVTAAATWKRSGVEYLPEKPFSSGEHRMTLTLCDHPGNRADNKYTFTVSDGEKMNVYRGEVHSHTSDSDGTGFAPDAMKYAREHGADYFAVTEHSHYVTPEVYSKQTEVADAADAPGSFAAIYGWEMTWNNTSGYWGHMNVLNTRDICNNINKTDMPSLFGFLAEHPETVAMFNHPGYGWGNFDEYAHKTPEADRAVCLAEIKGAGYDREYAHMLSMGWHASPVSNEDNHAPSWTTASSLTGKVLAPALTRQNVIDAFRARRTYSTSDPTMDIRYKINGCWLGSRLDAPKKLAFDIEINTDSDRGIGLVQIIAEDNIVVAERDAGVMRHLIWRPLLNPDFDYYYVRVTAPKQYTVTSPVWIENRVKPEIADMNYSATYDTDLSAAVSVVIKNQTGAAMNKLHIDYYLTGIGGFRLENTEPYASVCAGRLAPGGTLSAARALPELSGVRRVSAVITAECAGVHVCSTEYILISPVTVTEVMPSSSPFTRADGSIVEQPFPYITLYNSSSRDITLNGGRLALWTVTGKAPQEDRIFATDGVTVRARSTAVIWVCPENSELTCDDFNARYSSSFAEGENLYITNRRIVSSKTEGRRLELILDGEVVSRVHWNYGVEYDGVEHTDTAYRYMYVPNMTLTSKGLGMAAPAPGTVDTAQMRRQVTVVPRRAEIRRERKLAKKSTARKGDASRVHKGIKNAVSVGAGVAVGAAAASLIARLIGKDNK